MPNGGTDNCYTCKYNVWNNDVFKSDYCRVRAVPIRSDLTATYCANHPERNPDKDYATIPIGPMTEQNLESKQHQSSRKVILESPDTPEVREQLLTLLSEIQETPDGRDCCHFTRDETVIWQLARFLEKRALPDLQRISKFDPSTSAHDVPRTRANTVSLAKRAITAIDMGIDVGEFGVWTP